MTYTTFRRRAAALACVWVATVGCSGKDSRFKAVVPVRGKVTSRGQPVDGAQINFAPVNGGADAVHAAAVTESDGTFRLSTYKKADGAPPGEYVVTVYWPDTRPTAKKTKAAAGEELAPDRLNGIYSDPAKSKLRATVREQDNDVAFDLP